ncbi:hypothetical protein [Plantactinospora sp. DSM 117369]
MRITAAIVVIVRLLALAVLSWLLVAFASPTPDPFVVGVGWLLAMGVVLTVPQSRRFVVRWVGTGQLTRSSQ